MNLCKIGIVAVTAVTLAAVTPAFAKHHSNTFHKIGSALQYGVRKDSSNLSIDAHRALGHKSVEHRRYGHYRRNVVITPGGHVKPVYHHGHRSRYHYRMPHTR